MDCKGNKNEMKTKFLNAGVLVKVLFVHGESDELETKITFFQDTIDKLIPEWKSLDDAALKSKLSAFDELVVEINKKNVVMSVTKK